MTREKFIKELEYRGYSYKLEGDKIVITYERSVYLILLTSLPPGVEFRNGAEVSFPSLETLPPDVEFMNKGSVWLKSLKSLSPEVVFRNGKDVYLMSLIGGWFSEWKGNIEGVDSKELLNKMIEDGVFNKGR